MITPVREDRSWLRVGDVDLYVVTLGARGGTPLVVVHGGPDWDHSYLLGPMKRIARERRLTLLFTEHDMAVVFGIAERISVLHHGEIIASGEPDAVRNDPEVRRVYLGEQDHG